MYNTITADTRYPLHVVGDKVTLGWRPGRGMKGPMDAAERLLSRAHRRTLIDDDDKIDRHERVEGRRLATRPGSATAHRERRGTRRGRAGDCARLTLLAELRTPAPAHRSPPSGATSPPSSSFSQAARPRHHSAFTPAARSVRSSPDRRGQAAKTLEDHPRKLHHPANSDGSAPEALDATSVNTQRGRATLTDRVRCRSFT